MKTTAPMAALLLAAVAPGQDLRHAAASADLVVVATATGTRLLGPELVVHSLRVEATLRGPAQATVSVVEHKRLSEHQRPRPAERRLYCLRDFSAKAHELGLPASAAPYYKMLAHRGSNPLVGDPASDPAVELARLLIESEAGAAPAQLTDRLLRLVFEGPPGVRDEAVSVLAERASLRDALGTLQRSQLLSRAVGETEDVTFKIALALLCAEMRLAGLVDALCISIDSVEDPRFAEALGRIARLLHGEQALEVLRPHLLKRQRPETRGRLLLALGATSTEAALEALLRMRSASGDDKTYVEAALRAHGAPRALDAAGRRDG